MIIPLGTDAPIYHWPVVTVGIILINIAAFFLVPPESNSITVEEDEEPPAAVSRFETYALALGDGVHPVQWLTCNFLHFGILHLAGNMLFLWSFGIAVEGKLGPFKYLAAYLLIATLFGASQQLLYPRSDHVIHAAGASAMVFALLGMCMIWAPKNELNCVAFFFIGFRVLVFHWDLSYTVVALFYLAQELFHLFFHGSIGIPVVTELGHLSGGLWGCLFAVGMLKAGLVDCEGWDVFTLASKRRGLAKDWKKREERLDRQKRSLRRKLQSDDETIDEKSAEERAASAVKKVQKLIAMGDFAGAVSAYDKSARTLVRWPPREALMELIKAMHAAHAEVDSIPLMRHYCRDYPNESARMRLKLAQVLIRDRQRPTAGLRVLAEFPAAALTPELDAIRQKLMKQAHAMQEDGVLELEGDD